MNHFVFSILLVFYFLRPNDEFFVNVQDGSMIRCFPVLHDIILLDLFVRFLSSLGLCWQGIRIH